MLDGDALALEDWRAAVRDERGTPEHEAVWLGLDKGLVSIVVVVVCGGEAQDERAADLRGARRPAPRVEQNSGASGSEKREREREREL